MCERETKGHLENSSLKIILRSCCAGAQRQQSTTPSFRVTPGAQRRLALPFTSIPSFTEPPAVPEATSTTPLYLHVPTHAAEEHGTLKRSENETSVKN